MDLALKDKVVLITGGAKGIGATIAHTVAQEGAIPVVVDRDQEAAEKLYAELQQRGSISYVVIAELATAAACSGAVEQTLKKFARIESAWKKALPTNSSPRSSAIYCTTTTWRTTRCHI